MMDGTAAIAGCATTSTSITLFSDRNWGRMRHGIWSAYVKSVTTLCTTTRCSSHALRETSWARVEDQMAKLSSANKGFVANYKRRLPTVWENISDICIKESEKSIIKELRQSVLWYDYFRGFQHRQALPKRWGAGDAV